jgi:hypothetical protein
MSAEIEFKPGDSFDLVNTSPLVMEGPSGPVTDFTVWTAAAQVRLRDNLVEDLAFDWLDAASGLFRVYAPGPTDDWPIPAVECDIQFTAPDETIVSTETFIIRTVKGVTR